MNSRQQKLKYGELLRQQMKEKEELKKMEKMQKRGGSIKKIPMENAYDQQPIPQQIQNHEKLSIPHPNNKEFLQQKMEIYDYNPYGKSGGGAPNRSFDQRNAQKPPQAPYPPQYQQPKQLGYPPSSANGQYRQLTPPPYQNYASIPSYNSQNNQQYAQNQYPPSAQYEVANLKQAYGNYQGMPTQQEYVPNVQLPSYAPPAPYGYRDVSYLNNDQSKSYPQQKNMMQKQKEVHHNHQPEEPPKIIQNQDIVGEAFKKGGRNLLKLQNQTLDEIKEKQNKKAEYERELKRQMEQVQNKKKQQKRQRQLEEIEEERKQKEYLQRERLKLLEEERGKNQKNQNLQEQNAKNLLIKKEMEAANNKKEKFKQVRQNAEKQRNKEESRKQAEIKQNINQNQNRNIKHQIDEIDSAISNDTQMSKGFNTAISKEFFKKERERNFPQKVRKEPNVQAFTGEIQKMRNQINNQGQMFKQEIDKVKRQAERARQQKRRADMQIQKLKEELKRKMDTDNKKYLQNIYKGKDNYYADQSPVPSLKPKKNEVLIQKPYEPHPHQMSKGAMQMSDLMSLDGDSKKIPVNLDTSQKLTISRLGDFAKETGYFMNKMKSKDFEKPTKSPQKYLSNQQSIKEQDQQRIQSRKQNRNRPQQVDILDNILDARSKSRGGWGQMSSVNDDITNEIQNLLQTKQRPKSHLSNMGQQSLARNSNGYYQKSINDQYKNSKMSGNYGKQSTNDNLDRLDILLKKYQ